MEILHGADVAFIANNVLDELPAPSKIGNTRISGVDLNKPRMRAVFEAVLTLVPMPNGFSRAQLADRVREILGSDYTPRQATYDLKKLRAKNLIRRVARSRQYETTPSGLPTITGLIVLREKVIRPVLAAAGRPPIGRPAKQRTPIDEHYRCLQRQMRSLLMELRIAA
jgi:DNA-binding transcriptional ArsR family regulator